MKNLDEIEKMSVEKLSSEAQKQDETLSDEMSKRLSLAILIEQELEAKGSRKNNRIWHYLAAAMAACIAILAFVGYRGRTPQDTYSDPYQAYAEVERVFALISNKSASGLQMAQINARSMQKPNQIIRSVEGIKLNNNQ